MKHHKIMVIDYGSQYTQLITRRVRELKVYSEIYSYDITQDDIDDFSPAAIILSGGPSSVYDKEAFPLSKDIINSGLPVLGICYGLQLLVHNLGGDISSKNRGEYGLSKVSFITDNSIFKNLNNILLISINYCRTWKGNYKFTTHTNILTMFLNNRFKQLAFII